MARLHSGFRSVPACAFALVIFPVIFVAMREVSLLGRAQSEPSKAGTVAPEYDRDGALLRPRDFYSWVFVGASIGLSYSPDNDRRGPGQFHNVYVKPECYEQYLKTKKFPEKTVFVMPLYSPAQKLSINQHGYFEGELVGLDVSVKDHERFPEGWAYFNFSADHGKLADRAQPFPKEKCYKCHATHGADDNVFVQFYPVLRGVQGGH